MPSLSWPTLALLALACVDKADSDSGGDSGSRDGGASDGGTSDGGASDGGGDGGSTDGGASDGGGGDGGTSDGGGTDGGTDGGTSDDGGTDGGTSDGGGTDGGTWEVFDAVQATDLSWEVDEDIGTVLHVGWSQLSPAEAWVEFSTDGHTWSTSPPTVVEAGPQQALILGVPYGTDLAFRVVNDFGEGPLSTDAMEAATDALPDDAPIAHPVLAESDAWEPSARYLWTSVRSLGRTWLVIVDRQGDLVWARQQDSAIQTFWTSLSRDGTALLWDDTDFFGDEDKVLKVAIDGTVLHTYDTPHLHHAFAEVDGGAIAWQAWGDGDTETIEQVEVDGETRSLYEGPEGWHTNALWWDEDSDSLLSSYYTHHTILHIDRPTGEVLASWGQEGEWSFSPSGSQFWFQHGANLTPDGTLLVSCHTTVSSDEAVLREYSLDEAGKTLEQRWSVGEGEGEVAEYYGEALRLPDGNTLRNYGSNTLIREIDPSGEVVWELQWLDGSGDPAALVGHMAVIEDLYALAP